MSPAERLAVLVDLFYARGFELVSRLNDAGEVTATISSRRVAAIRLRIDAPARNASRATAASGPSASSRPRPG